MKQGSKRLFCILLSVAMLLPLLILPTGADTVSYVDEDFDGFDADVTLTKDDGFAEMPQYNTTKKENGNTYLRVPLIGTCTSSSSHTGNVDDSVRMENLYISAENGNFAVEASYRPHWIDVTEIRGYDAARTEDPTIQCQFLSVDAEKNPNSANVNYRGLYKINLRTGHLSIMGTHTGAAGLVQDQWNTVKLVIDPEKGVYDTYVNGVLYATDGYFGGDSNEDYGLRGISVPAGKLIIAKCNKNVGAYVEETATEYSYMDVDNVKAYSTDEQVTVKPICDVDFERFDADKVLSTSDGFAQVPTYNSVKAENGNLYAHIPYLGKCIVSSGSGNEGNPDNSLRVNHSSISWGDGNFVVESSYRIHYEDVSEIRGYTASANEDPTVQCQFLSVSAQQNPNGANTNYRGMYKINLRTGHLSGMGTYTGADGLKQDEWNTVKLVIDPVNAVYSTYVNDVLYATDGYFGGDSNEDAGLRNLTIPADKLIIAKCNKNVGAFVNDAEAETYSYVDVDNVKVYLLPKVSVTVNGTEQSVYDMAKLSLEKAGKTFLWAEITEKDGESYVSYDPNLIAEDGLIAKGVYMDLAPHTAALRMDEVTGLRFVSKVNAADYAALKENPLVKELRLGTVIIPTLYKGVSPQLLTAEALPGLKSLNFPLENESWYTGATVADYHLMAASIVNIKEENYNYEFSGIGYMIIEMQDGTTITLTTAKAKDVVGVRIAKEANDMLGLGILGAEQSAILQPFASAYDPTPVETMKEDLKGLDVLAMGDSTFAGDEFGWDWQWVNWMGSDLSWNLSNLSYGGSSISYKPGQNQASIVNRLENEPEFKFGGTNNDDGAWRYTTPGALGKSADEVDLIILSSGFNDYGGSGIYAPVGEKTLENRDTTTYIGAWNVVLEKLQAQYVNAKILIINQWHLNTAYAGAPRGDTITCYEYTNSIADMYNMYYHENDRIFLLDSGDPDISGIYMMDPAFRLENSRNPGDVFHLNKTGMEKMKNAVLPYIWNFVMREIKAEK